MNDELKKIQEEILSVAADLERISDDLTWLDAEDAEDELPNVALTMKFLSGQLCTIAKEKLK